MKAKTALLGVVGVVVGIVTLQKLRERRNSGDDPSEEAKAAARDAFDEASQAVGHSVAAVGHARTAGGKVVETASEGLDDVRDTTGENRKQGRTGRIRDLTSSHD